MIGLIRARFAVLADHYHLTMPEIAALTDRQIAEIYFHARDDKGMIKVPVIEVVRPEKEETLESVLSDLQFLKTGGLITEENYLRCVEGAHKRFNGASK